MEQEQEQKPPPSAGDEFPGGEIPSLFPAAEPPPPFPFGLFALLLLSLVGAIGLVYLYQRRNKEQDEWFDQTTANNFLYRLHPKTYEEWDQKKQDFAEGKITDDQLKHALVQRCIYNVPLLMTLQKEAPGIMKMYQTSMIEDAAWRNFKASEAMMEQELKDAAAEAEELITGWGAQIWALAVQTHQQVQANMFRKRHAEEMKRQEAMAALEAKKREAEEMEAAKKREADEKKRQANKIKREKQKDKLKERRASENAILAQELADQAAAELLAMEAKSAPVSDSKKKKNN